MKTWKQQGRYLEKKNLAMNFVISEIIFSLGNNCFPNKWYFNWKIVFFTDLDNEKQILVKKFFFKYLPFQVGWSVTRVGWDD